MSTDSTEHPEAMRSLLPTEELAFLREIYGLDADADIVGLLKDSFQVIQARAQILLSLIVICLTITGFSGRRIAESGPAARLFLGVGILAVLASALILFCGPLRIQWMTSTRGSSLDASLVHWIERRNQRTRRYHLAVLWLVIGLTGYVLSVTAYLLVV
ncbi:MAG: hypothetical protein HN742_04875 [Lentisphaerae bacterium]|jgi:hypothetical protein|nr:hypothetical protein [Lentisphaerota bacterium]MBT4819326.1 hypothetical protein [Lentisphaerota bacterium]MBT5610850.1 hypothetical protein [Lentisphaerota bacterium]MBT7053718.1 hypothetical protein [Lentisphaerota bacterium]MBT7841179.1 hypothetical protein [Lentisphaerota bacterium]